MLDKIFHKFEKKNHKEVMLNYIYLTILAILAVSVTINIFREYYLILNITIVMLIILSIGYYFYQQSTAKNRVEIYITYIIILSELVLATIIFQEHFLNYSTVFPLLITFGIFYFYDFSRAMLMTIIHLLFWTTIHIYGYFIYPDNPILHNTTAMMGLIISYVFMTMFGFSYYISTYIYQRKLEQSNHQKEILLKEIHHRVKNNLNIVASILGLEKFESDTKEVHKLIHQNKLRIESIAMVHEILYESSDLEQIDFKTYIQKLTTHILQTEADKKIDVKLDIVKLSLNIESMMQFGIIINELITNSIKHAFHKQKGEINISLVKHEHEYKLIYQDNGMGLQGKQKGFGSSLIEMSVQQLGGRLHMSSDNGILYKIYFEGDVVEDTYRRR